MLSVRRRYVPDLQEWGGLCEANYLRLLRLVPQGTVAREFLLGSSEQGQRVRLLVEEEQRYTTTLRVEQEGIGQQWLQPQCMQVRMYHDASVAEVLCYQQQGRFDGRYDYPNVHMRQPDEKIQINRFLAEWLQHCLRHGRAKVRHTSYLMQ